MIRERMTPRQAVTPLRAFRCDDKLWAAAQAEAARRGEPLSAALRRALARYVAAGERATREAAARP